MSLSDNERKKRKAGQEAARDRDPCRARHRRRADHGDELEQGQGRAGRDAAADHAPHGAAGSALLGFLALWVVFVVIVLVIYGLVRAMRRKPEPTTGPPVQPSPTPDRLLPERR